MVPAIRGGVFGFQKLFCAHGILSLPPVCYNDKVNKGRAEESVLYERIVFDFDGTLLDTSRGVFDTFERVSDEFGLKAGREELPFLIGPPLFETLKERFGFCDEKTLAMVERYRSLYREIGLAGFDRYPDVEPLLRRLRLMGRRLYVATNKLAPFARRMLESAGLDGYFEAIEGAGPQDRKSNKADNIARLLGGDTRAAVMVGDRRGDVEAAREAGVPCVYVGYGFGSKQEADACGADAFAPDVRALARILGAQGLFISFEGVDGSGKTTQIALLEKYLLEKGERVTRTYEPGGCPIAEKIRDIVLDVENGEMRPETEALLFAAARAQHVREVIRPALEKGEIVLCDRYADSSIAFQGYGRGLGEEEIRKINEMAMDGVWPARTYCLAADPEVLLARRKHGLDRIERADADFRRRVAQGFESVRLQEPERVFLVDATCSRDAVFAIIKDDINRMLFGGGPRGEQGA